MSLIKRGKLPRRCVSVPVVAEGSDWASAPSESLATSVNQFSPWQPGLQGPSITKYCWTCTVPQMWVVIETFPPAPGQLGGWGLRCHHVCWVPGAVLRGQHLWAGRSIVLPFPSDSHALCQTSETVSGEPNIFCKWVRAFSSALAQEPAGHRVVTVVPWCLLLSSGDWVQGLPSACHRPCRRAASSSCHLVLVLS